MMRTLRNTDLRYLEAIATICFPVDHIQHFVLHRVPHGVTGRPVVAGTSAFLVHIDVLRVVDVLVWPALYALNDLLYDLSLCSFPHPSDCSTYSVSYTHLTLPTIYSV